MRALTAASIGVTVFAQAGMVVRLDDPPPGHATPELS